MEVLVLAGLCVWVLHALSYSDEPSVEDARKHILGED